MDFLGFPGGSEVKKKKKQLPANADPWVHPWVGRSLEKEMATHASISTWEIPWTEEPGGLQSMGCKRIRHGLATKLQQ